MALDVQQYCQRLRERLIPQLYKREVQVVSALPTLLIVRGRLLGRYALAVFPWDSTRDGMAQLKDARRRVANCLLAFPLFGEVGLYIVSVGPKGLWSEQAESMLADRTGLHRVIVQAVHFVDLQTGAGRLNQSAWGSVHFGGVDGVAPIVKQAIS